MPHREALERYLGEKLGRSDFLETVLEAAGSAVVVTNPRAEDNPIVFVTQGFEQLTGYTENEVLGRNCRFLQGDDNDQAAVAELRRAVATARSVRVTLRNYRKDGTLFWNELYVAPVFGADGRPELFTGVQVDVTELHELEQGLRAAEARERHSAELRRLEGLGAGPGADASADPSRALESLSSRAPDLAARFAAQYQQLLEDALENRAYHADNDVSTQLRALAHDLARARAGARDVVGIHTLSLKIKAESANPTRQKAYAEEGRWLVLELMGRLLGDYRAEAFSQLEDEPWRQTTEPAP